MANNEASGSSSYSPNAGSLYSFSVLQPYTNWPIHPSSTTTAYYPSTLYNLPLQQYTTSSQKTYREFAAQTESEDSNGKGKGRDVGESAPQFAKQWETALTMFLKRAGLHQALAGLQDDLMMLNEEWEREQLPDALQALVREISELPMDKSSPHLPNRSLEDRIVTQVRAQSGVEVQTPSASIKSISRLLRQSRKRNDASNRAEFLQSTVEKRRRLSELGRAVLSPPLDSGHSAENISENASPTIASCARADAKPQDRDIQMKYDIAKNEDGPLKRTMKREQAGGSSSKELEYGGSNEPKADRQYGIVGRFETIESHIAVRYVPITPYNLLDRLKLLEEYIIGLEKDFPPWAALHFNQPHRHWPPPPRLTPIIVPAHLAVADPAIHAPASSPVATPTPRNVAGPTDTNTNSFSTNIKSTDGKKAKSGRSSLQRAVMEKLEIQRAMGDLAGGGTMPPQ